MIAAGANINQRTNDGTTALHLASQSKNIKIVKLLIDAGSELDGYVVKSYSRHFGQLIVDNININKNWKMPKYLHQEYQQKFPESIVRASRLNMYD